MTDRIFEKIEKLIERRETVVIAIDGMSAAGKTTFATQLREKFNGEIIPMDSFFLPPQLRSIERSKMVGGNVHFERFLEEIITPILQENPIQYKKFDCKKMEYSQEIKVPKSTIYIVEGSYCMRREFRKAYDLTIFLSCSKEEQERRILVRNGKEQATIFREKWIPMENTYFEKEKIQSLCDFLVET